MRFHRKRRYNVNKERSELSFKGLIVFVEKDEPEKEAETRHLER